MPFSHFFQLKFREMKSSFEEAKLQTEEAFKRDTGLSLAHFEIIVDLVQKHIEAEHTAYPNKTKGKKPSLSVANRVLLCVYYLRHHPTFINLGDTFGISESYANKIYHYILSILVQVLSLEGADSLKNTDLDVLVVDVTEQETERPVKKQKKYYSGKKKAQH